MRVKRVLRPERLRRVPAQFSWIDQRLVRGRHIERCDVHALARYLFLVTVADAQGLSYYGEASLARLLSIPAARLNQARRDLIAFELIAYAYPLYQVLALDPPVPASAPAPAPAPSVQTVQRATAHLRATLNRQRVDNGAPRS